MTDRPSFLDVIDYKTTEEQREKLLAHFNVPKFVANNTCFELNGYFGSKASYDDQVAPPAKHVTSHSMLPTDPTDIAKG